MLAGKRLLMAALFLAYLPVMPAHAGETVVVIVNIKNVVSSMSTREVSRIYRNHILRWADGNSVILYDLMVNNPVREVFSEQVLDKSASREAERWAHLKITNQAKNPPHTLKSERLIIKKVSRQRRAMAYVSMRALKIANNPNVKVVLEIE
jgi:ABC-type phosphate transport system substrate-binding protein